MTRSPLSTTSVVVITIGGIVVAVVAGFAIAVMLLVALVIADLAPATEARFSVAKSGPSCSVSGDKVEVRYPIAGSVLRYSIYNAPKVRPDQLSGLTYVAVDTEPTSPPDGQPDPQEPQYRRLRVTDGSIVVLQLRLRGQEGSIDGLHFDWAEGERGSTQTLPLTLRVTSSSCTVH
jgi:hypothetical protein